ncbi:hypothetical protein PVAP13_1KG022500 [Panicum virgatum]|uniref:Uncharacterized protein n=1 Tax=Panicum virgatum TaxID=38727 RepID=A0A8T0X0Y9_PANVG|nr:hypothetical protein PVAP13_1KG022500 [Panicum virgatum]
MKALAFAGIAGVVIPLIAPEIVRLRNALEDDLVQKYNSVNGIKDELMSLTYELSSIQSWVEKLEQIIWPCDEMLDWSRRATKIRYEVDHYISEFLCEENSCTRDFIVRASSILTQDHGDLLGCQGQLNHLIGLLQIPKSPDSLKVITIVGSVGSGKTALALEAFNSIGNEFESRASICVSGCVDTRSLLKDICMQVGAVDLLSGEL